MEKKIIFPDSVFTRVATTPKDKYIVTQITMRSMFDQVLAAAIGVKEAIFQDDGQRRSGLRTYGLDLTIFGAVATFVPVQKNLFNAKAPEAKSIRFGDARLIKLRDGEQLRLSFSMYIADIPYGLLEFLEIIKKEAFTLTISPPAKGAQETAAAEAINFGLFKKPKDHDDPDDEDDAAAEADIPPAEAGEPTELSGSALASWRQIHGRTPRVPPRESLKQEEVPAAEREGEANGNKESI